MSQKSNVGERKKVAKSLMSRNVTEFKHLLNKCYITESDLNWTMGLRDNVIPKSIEHRQPSAPQVFYKKTALSAIRDELKLKQQKITINASEYEHMLTKKIQKTPSKQTLDQLRFYTDLRRNQSYQKTHPTKSLKQFNLIPYKEKHQFPAFIKKQFVTKTGTIDKQQKQSAFDGAYNQQQYTVKMRTKNYGFFQPLARAKGRSKVALPTLGWQMGLRNY